MLSWPTPLFAEISLRGTFPWWLAALLLVALAVPTVLFYRREAVRTHPGLLALMAALRIAAFAVLAFLLLRPVLVREFHGERPRPVALLLDNSQSMTQRDPRLSTADRLRVAVARNERAPDQPFVEPLSLSDLPDERPSRVEVVKGIFANPRLNLRDRIAGQGKSARPLQVFLFGQEPRSSPADGPDWLAPLTGSEPRTALTDAVANVLQRDENELPSAVVLVTDGRDNASNTAWEDLGRECARLGVPLHIYGVGGSSVGFLHLKEAAVPDTLFAEDTVSVPVRWRCQGIKDGEIEISLTLNGRPVGKTKRVRVREGDDVVETISFTPDKRDIAAAKQELVTTIKLVRGGEVLQDSLAKSVRVIDRKVKVLVVENAPRWEFKFLQRALLRDRRVEASFVLFEGDRKAMESGPPFLPAFPQSRRELFGFDLLILGDVDASRFNAEQRNWIKDYVTEGGGLVVIAGRQHAPASWVGTPLGDVLPVEFQSVKFPIDSGSRPLEFKPRLSELGARSAMMGLADTPEENARLWQSLPGMYWHYPVTKLRPGAVSLLEHPKDEADGKPMPLLAMQYYGKGLVIFSAVEETWRWRYNVADEYFARFWGQVVYQAGLAHTLGSKASQLALDQSDAQLGRPSTVYARLFTPDFTPMRTERVTARLERLDAKPGEDRFQTVTLEAVPDQPGEYTATLPNDKVGRFVLRADVGTEPATLEYRVSLPPEHELAPGAMNEEALRRLAEQSGGKFYREEDLHALPDALPVKVVPYSQRQERLLWNEWWVVALFVGLLSGGTGTDKAPRCTQHPERAWRNWPASAAASGGTASPGGCRASWRWRSPYWPSPASPTGSSTAIATRPSGSACRWRSSSPSPGRWRSGSGSCGRWPAASPTTGWPAASRGTSPSSGTGSSRRCSSTGRPPGRRACRRS